jgi:superfamily II DNA or RNA helicase
MNNKIIIYIYTTASEQIRSRYKVGETTTKDGVSDLDRIRDRFNALKTGSSSKPILIKHWITQINNIKYDDKVRDELIKIGFRNIVEEGGTEWVESLDTDEKSGADILVEEISLIITGKKALYDYETRYEQSVCVNEIASYFNLNKGSKDLKSKFLIDAKPRFGKTFAALNSVNLMNLKNVLILTYTPSVGEEWFRQIKEHINFHDWQAVRAIEFSSINEIVIPNTGKVNILFSSAQDMLNYAEKDKWENVRNFNWDLIIFDEFDWGGLTDKSLNLLNSINSPKLLALTGTAFRLYTRRFFDKDAIFTWTYEMEQEKKRQEAVNNLSEIYKWLPSLNFAYLQIGKTGINLSKYYDTKQQFSFNKFFEVNSDNKFVNEYDIILFLEGIFGERKPDSSPYKAFNLRHSLWLLPSISVAKSLHKILDEKYSSRYKIINISGNGDHSVESHKHVYNAVRNRNGLGSITLSVQKFTRGITIPEWDSVFFLKHSKSASEYFQAAFRCQSPWKEGGKSSCYVIDYDINRILTVARSRALVLNEFNSESTKTALKNFFACAPILSYEGNKFRTISFDDIWVKAKDAFKFSSMFDDAYTYSMVNTLKVDSKNADFFKEIAKLSGDKFKSIAEYSSFDIGEILSNDSKLNNNEDYEETNVEKDANKLEDDLSYSELALLCQDLIKDILKYVFVSNTSEHSIGDVFLGDEGLFCEFTNVTHSQLKYILDSGLIDKDKLDELIISYSEEEEDI